jgi:hypothetical protein
MQGDSFVRFLLAVIAACLLVLVAQGFGMGEEEAELEAGRYSLSMMRGRGGQSLLRLDSQTGEVWRTTPGVNDTWTLLGTGSSQPDEPATLIPKLPPVQRAPLRPAPAPAPEAESGP